MKIEDLKNKKILILGYGVEGVETEKFLKEKLGQNAVIEIADEKNDPNYLEKQKNFDLAIKSPGIHKSKVNIPYTTATNIFLENTKGLVIGITGTKGKSTTTKLIYEILKSAFGKRVHLLGNITHKLTDLGKPLLSAIEYMDKKDQIYVCELSSYMLDDVKSSPHISIFTSFFPEHMNFHGSIENYFNAKANITNFQNEKDFFVYNNKFPELEKLANNTQAKAILIDENLKIEKTNLKGEHNLDNIKLAVTVAKILGVDDKIINKVVSEFKGLPHRLELIGEYKGINFYDDSISTTPESTIAAINSLDCIGTLMLGGLDRGYDFSDLAKKIVEKQIPNLVFFPESGKKILSVILSEVKNLGVSYNPNTLQTSSMHEAVKFAYENTKSGQIVLLSTASPSYTIWKNFEEKAKDFKEKVEKQSKN